MVQRYRKGYRFEIRVKEDLEEKGYFVIRSAGSKGVFDLIAIAPNGKEILGIQCKAGGKIPSEEKQEIIKVAEKYNIKPCLALKKDRKYEIIEV